MWAHQVGRPRTAAKGLDDLLLLGRHLFTPSPAVFDLHTLRRLALDDLPDHVGGHAARHVRGEKSSAFSTGSSSSSSRSCSWRSISPRTSLGGSSSSLPSSARLARASARSTRCFCSSFSRSCARRRGPAIAPGFCSPGQQFPGDCLRVLADLDSDSFDHALQVGLQPSALPGAPPAPCRAAPAPRGSGISACQLLPILGVSRVAGCGNRYLPRSSPSLSLSLVLDRYSLSLVQPSGADPPRSAGRPHVPPCRAAPTSMTCPSSASRGGALSPPVRLVGRGSPTGSSDLAYGRKAPGGGGLRACRTTLLVMCRWPG
jgi:hypothetical protein